MLPMRCARSMAWLADQPDFDASPDSLTSIRWCRRMAGSCRSCWITAGRSGETGSRRCVQDSTPNQQRQPNHHHPHRPHLAHRQSSRSPGPYGPCMPLLLTYRSSVCSTAHSFHDTTVMVYHSHVSYPYGITRRIACQATFSKGVPSTCSQPHATSPAANEKGPNLSSTLHPLSNAQPPKLTRSGSPARPGQPESPARRNQQTQWSHQTQRQPNQHQPQHPHQHRTPHR